MRILHVGVGNFGAGGVATYVTSLIQAQREAGQEIHLAELWAGTQTLPELETRLDSVESIGEIFRTWKADVLHLHSQLPHYKGIPSQSVITAHEHTSHCPSGARFLEGSRKVCGRSHGWLNCLRGHYIDRCGSRNPSQFLRKMGITNASEHFPGHWVAPATYTRDWLIRRGLSLPRIHLIHNPGPVPLAQAPSSRDIGRRQIVFLGRLVPNKGCDVLIEAVGKLPGVRLSILGEGPERPQLEAMVSRLGLADRIRFEGWVPAAATRIACEEASAMAIPSLWPEPFGLVALEASRAHLPVVASGVGGLLDIIVPGRTGLLVPPGDSAALASALDRIMTDVSASSAMGTRAARRSCRRFHPSIHLRRLTKVYGLVMGMDP